jgi:hypothetical protein
MSAAQTRLLFPRTCANALSWRLLTTLAERNREALDALLARS